MERKFTRGLNKPGMAAQLRESVSQVVRESAVLVSFVFVNLFASPLLSSLLRASFGNRLCLFLSMLLLLCVCCCCICICSCIFILFVVFILTFCDFGSYVSLLLLLWACPIACGNNCNLNRTTISIPFNCILAAVIKIFVPHTFPMSVLQSTFILASIQNV